MKESAVMTITRLEQYRSIKRQIEILESDAGISYLKGVDTTQIAVQSGKISNPTATVGLKLYELNHEFANEYKRLCDELQLLSKYIAHIKSEEVKEIAMRKFVAGQSYEQIGAAMFYDRKTVSRKLLQYIAHNVP